MKEKEEGMSKGEYEFGVLHNGRRYKKLRTAAEERKQCSEYPKHSAIIYIIEVY
jgi:hypothetical protein